MIVERTQRMHDLSGWRKHDLSLIGVAGIDHDGPYDHVIADRSSSEDQLGLYTCSCRRRSGEAHLIAVMNDGSRVGIPDDPRKLARFYKEDDPDAMVDDDAIRIIMAMLELSVKTMTALSFIRPDALDRLMNDEALDEYSCGNVCVGSSYPSRLFVVRLARMLSDYHGPGRNHDVMALWVDMVNNGILVRPGTADLIVSCVEPDRMTVDCLPAFLVDFLRGLHMKNTHNCAVALDFRIHDFGYHNKLAWSVLEWFLDDPYAASTIESWINILRSPYMDSREERRFNGLLDDEDCAGAASIISNLIMDESIPSMDWLYDVLAMAKHCGWDYDSLMEELDDGMVAIVASNLGMPSDYIDPIYVTDSTANGSEMVDRKNEDLQAVQKLLEPLCSRMDYENEFYSDRTACDYQLMVFLDDVDAASKRGLDMEDIDDVLSDIEVHYRDDGGSSPLDSKPGPDYEDITRFIFHWIVNRKRDLLGLPFSFYSQLPDFQEALSSYWAKPVR